MDLSSKFMSWEGATYRVDDDDKCPVGAFKLTDGVWTPISGKLIATLDLKGFLLKNPDLPRIVR